MKKHTLLYIIILLLSLAGCTSKRTGKVENSDNFDWTKATVYFVMTDRFCNGDSTNDVNYGRRMDYRPV